MSIVTYLTEKFLTEEKLNNLIEDCEDLRLLLELLEVKLCYIDKKQQHAMFFPIKRFLHSTNMNVNIMHQVIEKALLVQKDNSQFLQFSEFIDSYIDGSDMETSNLNVCLDLITVILKVCEQHNKTIDLKNFDSLLSKICRSENKLSYYFCVSILPRYLKHSNCDTEIIKGCLNLIVEERKLELLCFLSDFVLCSKYNKELLIVLDNNEFWSFIQDTLTNTSESFMQKQAAFLLQRLISFILENDVSLHKLPEIAKLPSVNFVDANAAWKNYFLILDISKEKQLHLIQPSLPLLNSIFCLHYSWIVCIFKVLFSHSQSQVVLATVNTIFKSTWLSQISNFKAIAPDLLSALNKIEYFSFSAETYSILLRFINSSNSDVFNALLEETCKVRWNPVILWVFLKAICKKNQKISVCTNVMENIFHCLHKLPHKYIREGCIKLFIRFLSQHWCNNKFSLESLIKMSSILFDIDKCLFLDFCIVFKEIILSHEESVVNKLTPLQVTDENVGILLEFAKLCDYSKLENMIYTSNETFLIDKLYILLYSSNNEKLKEELVVYIKERIANLGNDENIVDLKWLVQLLGDDRAFCKKHEAKADDLAYFVSNILKNTINYNIKQQEVAF